MAVAARQVLRERRGVVDEAHRLVDERRHEEVGEPEQHDHDECKADPDRPTARSSTPFEEAYERLGGHREHDRGYELDHDRPKRVNGREQHDAVYTLRTIVIQLVTAIVLA